MELTQRLPYFDKVAAMTVQSIQIEEIGEHNVEDVVDLIRTNLDGFEEVGSVLASSFRRIDNIIKTYHSDGSRYLVARDTSRDVVIGGAGIGPLHGLPASEGIGEIRELVIEESYRGRGIGTSLLRHCLEWAKKLGYQRLYLETTPAMENAQRLFRKFGFRPVTHAPGHKRKDPSKVSSLPCYYLLEDINEGIRRGLRTC
jgi:putative acetyltransferase